MIEATELPIVMSLARMAYVKRLQLAIGVAPNELHRHNRPLGAAASGDPKDVRQLERASLRLLLPQRLVHSPGHRGF
jgi:hypothetical protein